MYSAATCGRCASPALRSASVRAGSAISSAQRSASAYGLSAVTPRPVFKK